MLVAFHQFGRTSREAICSGAFPVGTFCYWFSILLISGLKSFLCLHRSSLVGVTCKPLLCITCFLDSLISHYLPNSTLVARNIQTFNRIKA